MASSTPVPGPSRPTGTIAPDTTRVPPSASALNSLSMASSSPVPGPSRPTGSIAPTQIRVAAFAAVPSSSGIGQNNWNAPQAGGATSGLLSQLLAQAQQARAQAQQAIAQAHAVLQPGSLLPGANQPQLGPRVGIQPPAAMLNNLAPAQIPWRAPALPTAHTRRHHTHSVPNDLPPVGREVSSPVWSAASTINPNMQQKVYVMYHSTRSVDSVRSILENGFRPSVSGMLGAGIYVSRDYRKAYNYGPYTFKLLVYPGDVVIINEKTSSLRLTWQTRGYDSAWIPPSATWTPNGSYEENCLKDKSHLRILGICQGYDRLPADLQAMVSGVDKQQTPLCTDEVLILKDYLLKLHLTDRDLQTQIEDLIATIEETSRRLEQNLTKHKGSPIIRVLEERTAMMDLATEELRTTATRAVDNEMMRALLQQGNAAHNAARAEEERVLVLQEKERARVVKAVRYADALREGTEATSLKRLKRESEDAADEVGFMVLKTLQGEEDPEQDEHNKTDDDVQVVDVVDRAKKRRLDDSVIEIP